VLAYIVRSPESGYGLKRLFSVTAAGVYRPSPGALYPALRRLVGRGLITVENDEGQGHRPRKLYRVTEAGRAAHVDWLRRPFDQASVANNLGLHIMRFAMMQGKLDRQEVLAFLKDLAEGLRAFIDGVERYLAEEVPPGRIYAALALQHGVAVHRASLAWAREAIATLDASEQATQVSALPSAAISRHRSITRLKSPRKSPAQACGID
jgi:DNA-binding PadR family transcriptional regulator